jgi:hypothetical protein
MMKISKSIVMYLMVLVLLPSAIMATEGTIVVPGKVSIKVNDESIGQATEPHLANLVFSTEGFEVGRDDHAPVSSDYFSKGHFPFNGTIHNMNVKYLTN